MEDKTTTKAFGLIMRSYMERFDISQAELSRQTGISTALIYKYYHNKSEPSFSNGMKILDYFQDLDKGNSAENTQ